MAIALIAIVTLAAIWYSLLRIPGRHSSQSDSDRDRRYEFVDLDDDLSVGMMSTIIVDSLAAQKAFVSLGSDVMPEKAVDNFSIGYIGGYTDAVLSLKKLSSTASGQKIGDIVFSSIFSHPDGRSMYDRYVELREAGDAAVISGMNVGDSDVAVWFHNHVRIPLGWSKYVLGEK